MGKVEKKKINVIWTTSDGKIFEIKEEAELYQRELNFKRMYQCNPLTGQTKGPFKIEFVVYSDEMKSWLVNNKDMVLGLLND